MFYGGMVQPKNYLHTVMQCFTITCLCVVRRIIAAGRCVGAPH
jgi:ammonia channel protein AmtB